MLTAGCARRLSVREQVRRSCSAATCALGCAPSRWTLLRPCLNRAPPAGRSAAGLAHGTHRRSARRLAPGAGIRCARAAERVHAVVPRAGNALKSVRAGASAASGAYGEGRAALLGAAPGVTARSARSRCSFRRFAPGNNSSSPRNTRSVFGGYADRRVGPALGPMPRRAAPGDLPTAGARSAPWPARARRSRAERGRKQE